VKQLLPLAAALALAGAARLASAQAPSYTIIDLGALPGDVSQAFAISQNGNNIVGRSFNTSATPTSWNAAGAMTALPELGGRTNAVALGVDNSGVAVGTASTTISGTNPLPLIWQNGQVSHLALPSGVTSGIAYDVNASNVAVGATGTTSTAQAPLFSNGTALLISGMSAAYAINNSGLAVGYGIDSVTGLRDGLAYNTATGTSFAVGSLSGKNGAIGFDISNTGYVVGASVLNQPSTGLPFIWSQSGGLHAIPLVNGATGWSRTSNVSTAYGVSDSGVIVGTAVLNGVAHAYELVPTQAVPEPGSYACCWPDWPRRAAS